ncbi:MAG TPA: O-antigen ligase family protein [Tepidisphaeraceae bacterium]|jgi:O-antigen ligase
MTALHLPITFDDERPRSTWPIKTGILLLILFGMAMWSLDASQKFAAAEAGGVGGAEDLTDRISTGMFQRQLAFLIMGVYGLWSIMLPTPRTTRVHWVLVYPLIVFVLWVTASAFWSVDRSMTLKRLLVLSCMLLAIVSVVRRFDLRQLAQIAFVISGLTALIGIPNEAYVLGSGAVSWGKWRFSGTLHPNHAGLNAIVLMLSSLYLLRMSKNKLFLLTFFVGFGILLVTKSRTALMSGVTAIVAFLLLATSTSRVGVALLLAGWGVAAVLWLSSMQITPDINAIASMGREDLKKADVKKLTGRTDIWKFALMQGNRDPNRMMIGYGYETFWNPINVRGVSEYVKFKISEGHNVYLDWYLDTGLVGVGLYVLILMTAIGRWAKAARVLSSPTAALAAAVLIGALVHGLTESTLADPGVPTFFSYAVICAAAFVRPDEEASI